MNRICHRVTLVVITSRTRPAFARISTDNSPGQPPKNGADTGGSTSSTSSTSTSSTSTSTSSSDGINSAFKPKGYKLKIARKSRYVLALETDGAHQERMTALRAKYFPPELNKLAAHVVLFHALPGTELARIRQDVHEVTSTRGPFTVHARRPFLMNQGFGINVRRGVADVVYQELRERWEPFLTPQDHSFKPHYTVQNKVDDPEQVKADFERLTAEFRDSEGTVTGLALYRYMRGGRWKDKQVFSFAPYEG